MRTLPTLTNLRGRPAFSNNHQDVVAENERCQMRVHRSSRRVEVLSERTQVHFIALFGVTLLPSELRPLPDTPRDCSREPVPQLPCHHNQLSPMMSLVRGKVG